MGASEHFILSALRFFCVCVQSLVPLPHQKKLILLRTTISNRISNQTQDLKAWISLIETHVGEGFQLTKSVAKPVFRSCVRLEIEDLDFKI